MRVLGRPVLGALGGLLLGLGLALFLLAMGVIALDSPLLVLAPVIVLVVGVALGVFAPFGSHARPDGEAAPVDTGDEPTSAAAEADS